MMNRLLLALGVAVVAGLLLAATGLAQQGGVQAWLFEHTSPSGQKMKGTATFIPLGGGLTPGSTGLSVLGLILASGTAETGSDGSTGLLWSGIGATCTSEVYAVATPHYAGGQARFGMLGGRDTAGGTIWVGRADGLGLDEASFDFLATCVGTAPRSLTVGP